MTGLVATPTNMKAVSLSWSGSAPKYNVYRGASGFTPTELDRIASVTAPSYTDAQSNTFVSDSQLGPEPFKTYAWIQFGEYVLDDPAPLVSAYLPILAL